MRTSANAFPSASRSSRRPMEFAGKKRNSCWTGFRIIEHSSLTNVTRARNRERTRAERQFQKKEDKSTFRTFAGYRILLLFPFRELVLSSNSYLPFILLSIRFLISREVSSATPTRVFNRVKGKKKDTEGIFVNPQESTNFYSAVLTNGEFRFRKRTVGARDNSTRTRIRKRARFESA